MIKLVVSDMDGSLLTNEKKLPNNFFEVLDRLHKKGIKFMAASGRSYCTLYENFKPKSDEVDYIADNGTCIVENGVVTYENILSKYYIDDIVKFCEKIEDIYLVLCGKSNIYIKKGAGVFIDEINKYYKNKILVDDLRMVQEDVFKIGIYDDMGAKQHSYGILFERFSDELDVVMSGDKWIDIMNKNANKGEALLRIQKKYNIAPEETMVFGDCYNDISMLKNAKYSFVMKNSGPDIKKFGNFIADSNDNFGVIKAIEKFAF